MPFVDCPICGEITRAVISNHTHTCVACGKTFYMPLCDDDSDESDEEREYDRYDAAADKADETFHDLRDNGLI